MDTNALICRSTGHRRYGASETGGAETVESLLLSSKRYGEERELGRRGREREGQLGRRVRELNKSERKREFTILEMA